MRNIIVENRNLGGKENRHFGAQEKITLMGDVSLRFVPMPDFIFENTSKYEGSIEAITTQSNSKLIHGTISS